MAVIAVLLGAAVLTGTIVGLVLLRFPGADPGSPRWASHAVAAELERTTALRAFLRARVDPGAATGIVLTTALAVIAVGAAAFGLLTAMVRNGSGLARYDRAVALWGAERADRLSTEVLQAVTQLGGTPGVIALAVVVGVVEHRRRPHRSPAAFLVLVVAGQTAVANLVKVIVDRARPDIRPLAGFAGSSFPSGHSVAAAACFAAMALILGRGRSRRVRAALAGGAVAIGVAVAATRVLLGVHWTTDVVAGLAVGWAWFALSSIAFGGRLLHFGAPIEAAERWAARSGSDHP